MQDSKLIKLLQSLTPEEWKYLRWFVQSNYFNTDANLLRLYEALAKQHPDFEGRAATKEKLYEKVYPGQPFSDGKWRNLLSKMTKVAEDYLMFLELEKDIFFQKNLLARAYGSRNHYDRMEKTARERIGELQKITLPDTAHHLEMYQLNRELFFHPESKKDLDKFAGLVENTLHHLDHFYLLERKRLSFAVANHAGITGDKSLLGKLSEPPAELPGNPLYVLFSKIVELLETGERQLFFEAKATLFASIEGMSKTDCQIVIPMLINYAIGESTKEEELFFREIFELYKLGLRFEVLLADGKMTDMTFLNIVTTGSKLKEFDWVADFIQSHELLLNDVSRKEILSLSWAYWHFHRGSFNEALQKLLEEEFSQPTILLNARSLLLRSHFELYLTDKSYFQLMMSECLAYERYVKRFSHLAENKKKSFLGMVAILKKVIKLLNEPQLNLTELVKLEKRLDMNPSIIARGWLEEKITAQKIKKARAV